MTTYDKTGWSHSCLYLQTFTHFHHLCYISPSVLLWTMLISYNGKKATQKPLTSVVVGGITGMTHEVTQHSIFFSLSYKIKKCLTKDQNWQKPQQEKEMMTCKGKKNERKKRSGQVLPLLAPMSDSTIPLQSSSVLPRCLPRSSMVIVHLYSSIFS